jgi:uncharacterized protein YbgA (DUF1722 family)
LKGVRIYSTKGKPSRSGTGIFAAAFIHRNPLIPVIDDTGLQDPVLRDNFIDAVFIYKRWQDLIKRGGHPGDIVAFHVDSRFLIMAHSLKHYTMLGRLTARAKAQEPGQLRASYARLLMEAARLQATRKKHMNVLLHLLRCFGKQPAIDEKTEMLEIIGSYQKGCFPLIVPITMINHFVRKYGEPGLARQYYLNPCPIELMLKNHVC